MNIIREINKEIYKSLIFLSIGLLALFIGYFLNFEKHAMTGIAIGFIPVGIGQIIIYTYAKRKPKMLKMIELEKEERNIFINTKAGHTAFWFSYWYIFISTMLSNVIDISLLNFLIFTLVFMPVIYFSCMIIYHKKY